MTFVVYFFVALIAAAGVLFGLDFMPAPMSPMPVSKYEIRAAVPPPPPPPPATVVKVEPRIEPKIDAKPAAPAAPVPVAAANRPAASAPAAPSMPDRQPASIVAAEPGTSAATPAPPAPSCNIDACASAYRSFTAADCTFQPIDGPRRLCTKGAPPAAIPAAAAAPPATAVPDARAQACNIAACSQSYPRSFSAADCTFQPSEGPRRICTK